MKLDYVFTVLFFHATRRRYKRRVYALTQLRRANDCMQSSKPPTSNKNKGSDDGDENS